MLRDAATDVFNLQYALLEKYGLATIEGVFFRGKLIFKLTTVRRKASENKEVLKLLFAQRCSPV